MKIGLSLVLIPTYGAKGMAIDAAAPQFILYLTLYPYFMAKVLGRPMLQILGIATRPAALALIVTGITALAMRMLLPPATWPTFVIDVLVTGAVALAFGWSFVVERSERDRLLSAIKNRFGKN